MVGIIVLQIVLIILNAIFSSAEISVISMNETKIKQMAEEGDRRAEKAVLLLEKPAKFLEAIQAAVTFAGLLSGAFVAVYFAELAKSAVMEVFAGRMIASEQVIYGVSVIVVTLILTYVNLLFGEILPKRAAMSKSEDDAFKMIGILFLAAKLFAPLAGLLHISSNIFLRMIGINPEEEQEVVTEEEIRMMVDIGGENGAIEEAEKEMIENIFEFNNSTAEEVMTHRTDVTSIWVDDTEDEILRTICDSGLSRFPVYNENMDDIIGILNTRDFLLNAQSDNPKSLRALLREAYFVPETVQADQLFRNMQVKKIHMAIVVDEYGGMSGIVTMEDLLEEIVGNIYDEFDKQTEAEIVRAGDNTWRISGSTPLKDVNDALDLSLPEDEDYDTLGGLIFSQFTTIPQDGSTPDLDCFGLHIHVEKLEDHRVETALVTKLATEDDHADDHPETLLARLRSRDDNDAQTDNGKGNEDR